MFAVKDDDSVIQYFIPIHNESKIECVYSPTNKTIIDLEQKIEELKNYIKNK